MARQGSPNAPRGLQNPTYQQSIREGSVNIAGKVECIWQPLYDYQTIPAAAQSSVLFFQTPIGASSKTLSDTNLELAGQIPKGQNFLVTGIQVEMLPNVAVDSATATQFCQDVYNFYKTGALVFRIGAKDFVRQGNLMKFAPVNRLAGQVSTGLAAQQSNYMQAAGREFAVADLMLESNQNFSVELQNLPATASTLTYRLGVTLSGFLYRNAQ